MDINASFQAGFRQAVFAEIASLEVNHWQLEPIMLHSSVALKVYGVR